MSVACNESLVIEFDERFAPSPTAVTLHVAATNSTIDGASTNSRKDRRTLTFTPAQPLTPSTQYLIRFHGDAVTPVWAGRAGATISFTTQEAQPVDLTLQIQSSRATTPMRFSGTGWLEALHGEAAAALRMPQSSVESLLLAPAVGTSTAKPVPLGEDVDVAALRDGDVLVVVTAECRRRQREEAEARLETERKQQEQEQRVQEQERRMRDLERRLAHAELAQPAARRAGAAARPPESFFCPITLALMRDPVVTADGHCE